MVKQVVTKSENRDEQDGKKAFDDVLKRMLSTPPKPHPKPEKKKPGK